MTVAMADADYPPDVIAAIKLAALVLQRSSSHYAGYGFVQTFDAREVGLVEGDQRRWMITSRGRDLLARVETLKESSRG